MPRTMFIWPLRIHAVSSDEIEFQDIGRVESLVDQRPVMYSRLAKRHALRIDSVLRGLTRARRFHERNTRRDVCQR